MARAAVRGPAARGAGGTGSRRRAGSAAPARPEAGPLPGSAAPYPPPNPAGAGARRRIAPKAPPERRAGGRRSRAPGGSALLPLCAASAPGPPVPRPGRALSPPALRRVRARAAGPAPRAGALPSRFVPRPRPGPGRALSPPALCRVRARAAGPAPRAGALPDQTRRERRAGAARAFPAPRRRWLRNKARTHYRRRSR